MTSPLPGGVLIGGATQDKDAVGELSTGRSGMRVMDAEEPTSRLAPSTSYLPA